jgi:2-hydroxy-6-oxonona-2,4-dienedioate hydrolase
MRRAAFAIAVAVFTVTTHAQAPPPPAGVSPVGALGGLTPKFVDVKGVRTRYYEAGAGDPLVLVHGEGWSGHSSANVWVKNIPGLAQRYHVVAADKLASGMTGNPLDDKDFNIQGEVEHMYQFIQTMKLGRVHLVGQSRGGGLAFFLSVAHPEIVRTLVIVDSLTASPDVGRAGREAALANCPKEPDAEEWKCRLRAITFKPDVAFDDLYFATGAYMASLPKARETVAKRKAGAGEPLESQFNEWKKQVHEKLKSQGGMKIPTLLYWGRNDPSAILRAGLELYDVLAEQNPDVRMIVANKAGHFHFREYPDEFNRNLINFIDYWSGPRGRPSSPPQEGPVAAR